MLGGARAGACPVWGWLIPRVPYPSLIPQGIQTAVLATRPRKGDVRKDVMGSYLETFYNALRDPSRPLPDTQPPRDNIDLSLIHI